jgi:hypothetical protein
VGTGTPTRFSKLLRALVCAILAASLGAQLLASGTAPGDRRSAVRIAAAASPAAGIHANSPDRRFEPSKHRTPGSALFLPAGADRSSPDRARAAAAGTDRHLRFCFVAHRPGGRAPPVRNSWPSTPGIAHLRDACHTTRRFSMEANDERGQPSRKMTFAENAILTLKVLAGFGLLGAVLWGVNFWTSAR